MISFRRVWLAVLLALLAVVSTWSLPQTQIEPGVGKANLTATGSNRTGRRLFGNGYRNGGGIYNGGFNGGYPNGGFNGGFNGNGYGSFNGNRGYPYGGNGGNLYNGNGGGGGSFGGSGGFGGFGQSNTDFNNVGGFHQTFNNGRV